MIVDHVHGAADVDLNDENDQANVLDVNDCQLDQRHVERSVVEESEPV